MNCVIKREEEKCMEMITSDDPRNDPEFGRFVFSCVFFSSSASDHILSYLIAVSRMSMDVGQLDLLASGSDWRGG